MYKVLLIDFGSTFTKVTVIDTQLKEVIGTSQSFTMVTEGIEIGLDRALHNLEMELCDFEYVYACSSAAGGLRMAVSGLVPTLTAKAAHLAALGAGAKVVRCYHHELTAEDLHELEQSPPDILLLCGGTDGGNRACIEGNAKRIASLSVRFPILYAGNRSAKECCQQLLSDWDVRDCPNVMPALDVLNVEPVQKAIREIFLEKITEGKGLSTINELLNRIAMPTPVAVRNALHLISKGTLRRKGMGDLMGIDVGGATTDVYSVAAGLPESDQVVYKGLPEPYEKRTVEGDIGMRYSVSGIVDAVGLEVLAKDSGLGVETVQAMIAQLEEDKSTIPSREEWVALDTAIARSAVTIGIDRHVGRWEEAYTPHGKQYVQTGKDLRHVKDIIVTGGAIVRNPRLLEIIQSGIFNNATPFVLRPQQLRVWSDRRYLLSAMGLLALHDEELAMEILIKEIHNVGTAKSTTNN